jgi:hypothetical protein
MNLRNKEKMKTYKDKVRLLEAKVAVLNVRLGDEAEIAAEYINALSNGGADKNSIKRLMEIEAHIESLYQVITSDQYSDLSKWGLMKSFIFERRAETEIRKVYS